MKEKIEKVLLISTTSLVIFFNEILQTFAQSSASSTSSSTNKGAPIGLLLMWLICNAKKRKAIGGWLLFYYISLFGSALISLLFIGQIVSNLNITNWGNETGQYSMYILSVIPGMILLILELILAIILLSKKFRNRKNYNFLRITFMTQLAFGLITLLIDFSYRPETVVMDLLPTIGYLFRLLYFTYSKRVEMVFIKNKRDSDFLYPPKEESEKESKPNKTKYYKCYKCGHKNPKDNYSCEKCGEVFRESKKKYDEYIKNK